ncbi:MAG: hypothetical protein AAGD01_16435 [Acidobacteriota bacterium]
MHDDSSSSKDTAGSHCPSIAEIAASLSTGRTASSTLIHWLEGCAICRENWRTLKRWAEEVGYPDWSVVVEERPLAHQLWGQLENVPTHRLKATIGGNHYFWAMASLLIRQSEEAQCMEPARAIALAESAAAIATILAPGRYAQRPQADLRGRAWVAVGEARRAAGAVAEAEQATLEALRCFKKGRGSALDQGRSVHLLGQLRKDQRRFSEAREAFEQAERLFLEADRKDLAGGVYLHLAALVELDGDTEGAIAYLTQAQAAIDPDRQRALYAACQQKLLFHLTRAGHYAEAEIRLPVTRRLWAELGHLENLTLVHWIQGQMLQGKGDHEAALETYRDVVVRFQRQRIDYWAAVVQLDIASTLAAAGQGERARTAARQAVDTLEKIEVSHEARTALSFLKAAAEESQLSDRGPRAVADFIRQLRLDPMAKFVPPTGEGPRGLTPGAP